MRRVLALLLFVTAAGALGVLGTGAGGDSSGERAFKVEIDNAFAQVDGVLKPIPVPLRSPASERVIASGQRNRCPGAAEHPAADRSNPWKPADDHNCDPSQVLPGG